ncbi:MAG: hypothetical protein ACT6XS_17015 [Phreatobacter sp.]|uniref:hypothetical protein n=1 Tax=Phreatobacter sp. TaxID=1966341 RepID=UPI0040365E0B
MSLRTLYAVEMAAATGLAAKELYEYERVIREAGGFPGEVKSGPGGGTPATAGNTAVLLLALLASSSKRNCSAKGELAGSAVPVDKNGHAIRCPLTVESTLLAALTTLLDTPDMAAGIDRIEHDERAYVTRIVTRAGQIVEYRLGDPEPPTGFRAVRILDGHALHRIAAAIARLGEGEAVGDAAEVA